MKKSKVEQICDFVKDKFDIPLDSKTFTRTRAGYWQRGLGAWSWYMNRLDGIPASFGSQDSVTEILKYKDVTVLFEGTELVVEHQKRVGKK